MAGSQDLAIGAGSARETQPARLGAGSWDPAAEARGRGYAPVQPKPAVRPHWSGYEVALPVDDAE
eukprot:COSAG01_NODE_10379_length_2181_cov_16.647454_2_plen_65_part_00